VENTTLNQSVIDVPRNVLVFTHLDCDRLAPSTCVTLCNVDPSYNKMEPERPNAHSGSTELHYKEAEFLGVIVSIGDSIRNYGKDIQGSQDQRTNGTDKAAETTGTEALNKMEVEKEMNGIDHAVIGLNAEQQDIKADIQSKHTISLPLLSVSVLSQSAPFSELLKKTNDPNHTPLHSLSQQPSMHSLKSLYSIHSLRSNSSSTRKDGVLVGTPVREG
jgi:hypothetical protein